MAEELGIIVDIHVGMRDVNEPVLWFSIRTLHGGSLQVMNWDSAEKFIREWNCKRIEDVNGKPCVVTREGTLLQYLRPHK